MGVCGMSGAALNVPDALEKQNKAVLKILCAPEIQKIQEALERLRNSGRLEK